MDNLVKRKKVLLTGAAGLIGSDFWKMHKSQYDFILFDRDEIEDTMGIPLIKSDLSNAEVLIKACEHVDAIVHLAAVPNEQDFLGSLLPVNIQGLYHLFEAARKCRVRKFIYASSQHVVGLYERDMFLQADTMPRPDSFYALTKSFGENMGQLYSTKTGMSVMSIRIGNCFTPVPVDERDLSVWISKRDMHQLLTRALDVDWEGNMIVYGVSANSRSWYDISNARTVLGYAPQDNAEDYANSVVRRIPEVADFSIARSQMLQGGSFAGYPIGYVSVNKTNKQQK